MAGWFALNARHESQKQDLVISFTRNSPRTPGISHILPAARCRPGLNETTEDLVVSTCPDESQVAPRPEFTAITIYRSQSLLSSSSPALYFSHILCLVTVCPKTTVVLFLRNEGLLKGAFKGHILLFCCGSSEILCELFLKLFVNYF